MTRKTGDSRKAKVVPSKSRPTSPAARPPASSAGRKCRTPAAPASPAPWRMSRTRFTVRYGSHRPRGGLYALENPERLWLDGARSRALRRAVRLAHARDDELGDARPHGHHRAPRGHLAGGRSPGHEHVPGRAAGEADE